MKREGVLKVTNEELRKLKVIEQVIEKRIKQRKAAELLDLSVRQLIRLVKRVRRGGIQGLIHRLRGKVSNHKHEEQFKQRILELCRKKYVGFGPTLASEKLEELNKLSINRETLRQWLLEEGLWELKRKADKHLEWRERKASFGEMTQVDGSHHDWLEGRGSELVLMGYIDDAMSNVFARFYDYEGTLPAMDSFYRYTKKYGLPHSIYIDRLSAYQGSGKPDLEEELAGITHKKSQFERALEELGVRVIHAQSPQAKGRIERLFRTFQDRLIKEMRLAQIKTKDEANRFLITYLPKYNQRFSVKARNEGNLHRLPPRDQKLKQILSIQEKRVIRNDNTIRHEKKLYQILTQWNGRKPKHVILEERLDGKLYVTARGKALRYLEIKEPSKQMEVKQKALKPIETFIPRADHPWRKLILTKQAA